MLMCPNCKVKLEVLELSLTDRQHAIRDAIEQIRRDTGRPATTRSIAAAVGYTPTTIRPDLHQLEALRIIQRPNGKKSGWALRHERIRLVLAQAA